MNKVMSEWDWTNEMQQHNMVRDSGKKSNPNFKNTHIFLVLQFPTSKTQNIL